MKIGNKLMLLTGIAAILGDGFGMDGGSEKRNLRPEDINIKPKNLPPPKGCKEYSFHDGEFKTIAISEKSAIKKYKKWLLTLAVEPNDGAMAD